jgi:CheY-like chemotaxis protein
LVTAHDATAAPHSPDAPPPVSTSTFSQRVLLAEDGPDNQRLIALLLRRAGATVAVVGNGREAVIAALGARDAGEAFDIILMDMQMPVLDGYQAATELRRARYDGVIIALTAHAMAHDRDRCIDAGCDDYVTKPIDRRQLFAAMRANLARVGVA